MKNNIQINNLENNSFKILKNDFKKIYKILYNNKIPLFNNYK